MARNLILNLHGVISADGKKLNHKVDLKFQRCTLCHDIGVTQRYNVILDFPTIIDLNRLFMGGSIIKFEKDKFARIGVMPRYGDADSVRWFEVEPCSMFHIINCYEEGDEVIVMGCRARDSIIPGPDLGMDKSDWFSRGFRLENSAEKKDDGKEEGFGFLVGRPYEWRLNTKTGEVKQDVYIIDAKNFTSEPVAKITLPCRVPYGFHGAFLPAIQPV